MTDPVALSHLHEQHKLLSSLRDDARGTKERLARVEAGLTDIRRTLDLGLIGIRGRLDDIEARLKRIEHEMKRI
jgi:hypothetical protein